MVGDMSEDIQAGKEAGTATAAALYGYGERAELEELDPDYLLEKIGGLFGIEGI
jgi:phosphoglycolate phosphatase-like HAD superfamily hydrolase